MVKQVRFPSAGGGKNRSSLTQRAPIATPVQTQIGYDPVHPGVEGRLGAKFGNVAVCLQKSLLIDILRILFRVGKPKGESKDGPLIARDQNIEGRLAALLRVANKHGFLDSRNQRGGAAQLALRNVC